MEKNIYLVIGMPGNCKSELISELHDTFSAERTVLVDCREFSRSYKSWYGTIASDKLRLHAMVSHAESEIIRAISSPRFDDIVIAVDFPSVEIALAKSLPGLLKTYNDEGGDTYTLHVEPVWTAREVSMDYMYKYHEGYYENLPREVMEREYEENYHALASLYLQHKMLEREKVNPYFTLVTSDDPDSPSHAIVVDMDDTMCFNTSGRHYVGDDAYDQMFEDTPNYGALCMVKNWLDSPDRKAGDRVIVLTGRDNQKEQEATREWWRRWLGDERYKKADILYLGRKKGGGVTTVEAKTDNYEAEVIGKYCVDFMLEDRPDIADIFRDIYGLWVFQTIKPYYGSCCF